MNTKYQIIMTENRYGNEGSCTPNNKGDKQVMQIQSIN